MVHFAYRSCSHVMSSQMQNEVPFMKENRLLFTNALIVLPTETINGSLAVEDGKITGIFESGTELPGFTEVDVHGKALMPGAIDTHVHMWDPSPLNYREDWACGSQCAASGGITTIIDMPLSVPPVVDKEGFQLNVLDILAHDEEELNNYQSLHREWKQVQQDLEDLIVLAEQNKADEDRKIEKKKENEQKLAERRAERKEQMKKIQEDRRTIFAIGTDMKSITENVVAQAVGTAPSIGGSCDVKA